MERPWLLACLLANIPWARCQVEVHQNQTALAWAGRTATLTCRYEASDFWSLRWFRQLPGAQPVSLLALASDGTQTQEPNLAADLETGKQRSRLHVGDAQLGDAATYFCAVATR